ncbi:MAG TPA: tetratricopeptide repeat protein [Patescibacteria group bacterium]|nr:tetratricopeptide repeat protein [Patescibacteria group bacterium]
MTNEELLAKYLEDSLSRGERAEFDRLVSSSPEFARDVQELSKIEGLLKSNPGLSAVPASDDFLASVENLVTDKIHHDKHHSSSTATTFSKILSGMWIVPILMLIGIGAFFLLRNTDTQVPQQPPVADQPVIPQQQPMIPQQQPQPEIQSETSIPEPSANQSSIPQIQSEPQQPAQVRTPDQVEATVSSTQSNDRALYDKTLEKLGTAREKGNRATEAALLKQMGILALRLGNIQEAKMYQRDAIALARSLKLVELEGEAMGEIGLVYKKEGDLGSALDGFKKAIDILKGAGKNPERWEKELKEIQP